MDKYNYLKRLENGAMAVNRRWCPPLVMKYVRDGLIKMSREGSTTSRTSLVRLTNKGRKVLKGLEKKKEKQEKKYGGN